MGRYIADLVIRCGAFGAELRAGIGGEWGGVEKERGGVDHTSEFFDQVRQEGEWRVEGCG